MVRWPAVARGPLARSWWMDHLTVVGPGQRVWLGRSVYAWATEWRTEYRNEGTPCVAPWAQVLAALREVCGATFPTAYVGIACGGSRAANPGPCPRPSGRLPRSLYSTIHTAIGATVAGRVPGPEVVAGGSRYPGPVWPRLGGGLGDRSVGEAGFLPGGAPVPGCLRGPSPGSCDRWRKPHTATACIGRPGICGVCNDSISRICCKGIAGGVVAGAPEGSPWQSW